MKKLIVSTIMVCVITLIISCGSIPTKESGISNDAGTPKDNKETLKDNEETLKDNEETLKDNEETLKDNEETLKDNEETPKDNEETPKDNEETPKDNEVPQWVKDGGESLTTAERACAVGSTGCEEVEHLAFDMQIAFNEAKINLARKLGTNLLPVTSGEDTYIDPATRTCFALVCVTTQTK